MIKFKVCKMVELTLWTKDNKTGMKQSQVPLADRFTHNNSALF